ncbi:50S ribosomal protein L17 [uncultured bacterium]|nr:50S ribosomal protein L17 [uncultured bacterium]
MRHNIRFKKLSRDTKHRISMMKNIAMSLLIYNKIVTTKTKSDAVISRVNKIINKIHKIDNIREKIRIIKMYIANHNIINIKKIINNIDSISNKNNHIIKTKFFKVRSDSANLIKLQII